MTDDELLGYCRAKHANAYMSLAIAKKMHHLDRKYGHLRVEDERGQARCTRTGQCLAASPDQDGGPSLCAAVHRARVLTTTRDVGVCR